MIPKPREILLFLEDNSGDWSATTLYIRKGADINASLINKIFAERSSFTQYIRSHYDISPDDLQELVRNGKVESNVVNLISSLFEVASLGMSDPKMLKGFAQLVEKLVELIKKCSIDEEGWNPSKTPKGEVFEPLLFPGIGNALDKMDDAQINSLMQKAVRALKNEIRSYDKTIEDLLKKQLGVIPLPVLFPFAPVAVLPVPVPNTFGDLLLAKYRKLRSIADRMLAELERVDFSDLLKQSFFAVNAFICGIWNGFIDAVCGIISLVQYLFEGAGEIAEMLKNFEEKGLDFLEKVDDFIYAFEQIDFGKVFSKLASGLIDQLLAGVNSSLVEIAYFCGIFIGFVVELVIEIVIGILFTGGALTVEAIFAKLAEIPRAIGELVENSIKGVVKVGQKTIGGMAAAFNSLLEFLLKGTDEILRIIDEMFAKFRELGEASIQAFVKERGLDKPFFSSVIKVVSDGIVYGQSKYYTCVATSLRMVLESKGLKYSEEYLAKALDTNLGGARVLDIPEALYLMRQETKVATEAYPKIKLDDLVALLEDGDTAIVSVFEKGKGAHAVVIDGVKNGNVIIRDPLPLNMGSSYTVSVEEFELYFRQKAVVIKR